MNFKSCFYHVEMDTCDSSKCLLCQAYIGGCTKYCRKCSQEKGICRRCGNPPIFIREEAIRAVQNYHLGATGNPYGLSEEMVSLKVKQYEQLIRDIEEGKLNDNKSIWKVINDILQ